MARKTRNPVVRAIADVMWKRDRLQMRAVDAVLSRPPARRPRPKPRRKPASKRRQ